MTQTCILILGGLAIYLLAKKDNKVKRWGYLAGLLSEPFWLVTAWQHEQWGIVILCLWYAWFYLIGGLRHWRT